MSACARKEIVRPGQPGIFHVYSQCVRQAFLMGVDRTTGRNYNHRRDWVVDRLLLLTECFAIDVAFMGIMSNHFHLILRVTPRLVDRMGSWEVARRWLRVYPGKRVLDGPWIEPTEEQVKALAEDKEQIAKIRKRLSNVSWFMAALCEWIARKANREDGCRGRFWAGRFGCREIRTEGGLLICGLYVDLNQIRAGEALTPESSIHCSVAWRIAASVQRKASPGAVSTADDWLAPLTLEQDHLEEVPSVSGRRASDKGLLNMTLDEYLQLLDSVGRALRAEKRGAIPADLAPILERLGLQSEQFVETVDKLTQRFRRMLGPADEMAARAAESGRKWFQGQPHASRVFTTAAPSA
jgi:hypothetical protein